MHDIFVIVGRDQSLVVSEKKKKTYINGPEIESLFRPRHAPDVVFSVPQMQFFFISQYKIRYRETGTRSQLQFISVNH